MHRKYSAKSVILDSMTLTATTLPGPVVPTTAGDVRGLIDEDRELMTWRGVPFGADTSGAHRFSAPRPATPWTGVRDCVDFGPPAPQPTYSLNDAVAGSEDCLHLDVVRPATHATLPVVVYLHGGSFLMGASHQRLLRGYEMALGMDVVYVSVNFRLGALGYLDYRSVPLGEDDEPCVANPAIHDQLLALEWVRDNIAEFGGDPDNVTLMGESAGGAAVTTLMCVPAAEGLFHRAIAQSPPVATIHSRAQSTMWIRDLLAGLDVDETEARDVTLGDLRDLDAAELVRAGQSMLFQGRELMQLNPCFSPTVDGELLPDHPFEAFAAGDQMKIPLVIGSNLDEIGFSRFMYQRAKKRGSVARQLLKVFDPLAAPGVLEAYDGGIQRKDFADLLGDAVFWAPAVRVAEAHSQWAPTWFYRFDYAPQLLRWLGLGAMHSLELSVIFGDPGAHRAVNFAKYGGLGGLEEVMETMQYEWAHFFHTGGVAEDWPEYVTDSRLGEKRATMIFNVESEVVYDPEPEKRVAWEGFDLTEWGTGRPELLAELGLLAEVAAGDRPEDVDGDPDEVDAAAELDSPGQDAGTKGLWSALRKRRG